MASLNAPSLKPLRSALVLLALALIFGLLTWAMYDLLTSPARYNNRDFMSLFAGAKALLRGVDPYDAAVWNPLRSELGSTWMPDEQAPFPLWTLVLFIPFALLDLGWAAAAWLAFSLCLLGSGLFLLIRNFSPRSLPIGEFFLVALLTFTYRSVLVSMNNGQITFVLFFALVLFVSLVKLKRPFLAGVALAFVVLKPNPFILFVPAFGLWLLQQRHWRIVAGAAAGGLGLFLVSWLVQPGWFINWLSVRGKTEATAATPTLWGLAFELWPKWWPLLGLCFVLVTTVVLGLIIYRNNRLTLTEVLSLTLIASLLATPYAWVYEYLLLLIPMLLLFLRLNSRRMAVGTWLLLAFGLPWATFWLAEIRKSDTFTVVVPLILGLLFYYFEVFHTARVVSE